MVVVYPVARLIGQAVAGWDMTAITEPVGVRAIRNTVVMSLLTVLFSGVFGTALAVWFSRYTFPGRDWAAALAYMPFTLPPLVGVLSFYYLIGRDGFVPRALERYLGFEDVYLEGPWAILAIHTYSFFVFFYAMVSASLDSMDRSLVEAARSLGATPLRAFFKVTLPLLRPALLGAATLTFMSSGASFSAPLIFGNQYPMLSVRIFEEREQHHDAAAVTLTVALAAVSLLALLLFRSRSRPVSGASKGVRVPIRTAGARLIAALLSWGIALVLIVPHLTILLMSIVDHRSWHDEVFPVRYTFENYAGLVREPGMFAPIRNSFWMSAIAAAITLAVAAPASYLIGRRRRGGSIINLIAMTPWALPGTVIAVSLIVAFNEAWMPLAGTIWLIPIAYVIRGIPLVTRMTTASVEVFDGTLMEAGRTLGGSPWYCFRRVAVPLLLPAIAAAMALSFATNLGEFVASILLWVPSNTPISVQINMVWRGSGIGMAFAYSVLLMIFAVVTFVASRRFASPLR